jgi:hypothetical protein
MVSFMYLSLFPEGKNTRYPLKKTLGGVHAVTKRKISSPQREPNYGSLVFQSVE